MTLLYYVFITFIFSKIIIIIIEKMEKKIDRTLTQLVDSKNLYQWYMLLTLYVAFKFLTANQLIRVIL